MSRRDGIQLAVGSPLGRRGSLYDIWFGSRDIYVGVDCIVDDMKATVHYERPGRPGVIRYSGVTTAYARRQGLSSSREDRARAEWPGFEFHPGYCIEFRLRIPECELRVLGASDLRPLNPGDTLSVHWLPAPTVGQGSEVTIISGPPTHVGPAPARDDGAPQTVILEKQLNGNGRFVWILHHHIPAPAPSDLRAYKEFIRANMSPERLLTATLPNSKTRRVVAQIDVGDGSYSDVEFSADFIGLGRKRRGHRAA